MSWKRRSCVGNRAFHGLLRKSCFSVQEKRDLFAKKHDLFGVGGSFGRGKLVRACKGVPLG